MALPEYESESLKSRIAALAETAAAGMGMEVVLVEVKGGFRRPVLQIFIDKADGITIDDCERFSKHFSVLLDVEDWIPFSYVLEVSSPGLDRPLVKEDHFARYIGRIVRIRTKDPIEGRRNFKGRLLAASGGKVSIEIDPAGILDLALDQIEKANLVMEI